MEELKELIKETLLVGTETEPTNSSEAAELIDRLADIMQACVALIEPLRAPKQSEFPGDPEAWITVALEGSSNPYEQKGLRALVWHLSRGEKVYTPQQGIQYTETFGNSTPGDWA